MSKVSRMFQRAVVVLLSAAASLAQIRYKDGEKTVPNHLDNRGIELRPCKKRDHRSDGVGVRASLWTPSPEPHTTVTTNDLSSYLKQCVPGDLIPGPTCNSFFKCVGSSVHATRRVKFECAAGTVFNSEMGTCVHGQVSQCSPEGPSIEHPAPARPPAPVWPPGNTWPTSSPAPPPAGSCTTYQLDPSTVYECLEPGSFQSHRDCLRFYRCIVTMGCVIKGFLYQCPAGYLFDDNTKRCQRVELLGPCDKAADAGVQIYEIQPIGQLQADSLDQFFSSETYWDFMPFLPNQTQKIVPIKPSNFSRGAGTRVGVFMSDN
nr:uncharacterized protein LOC123774493 [Procambarus clarkii]